MGPRLQQHTGVHPVDPDSVSLFAVHPYRPALLPGDGQGEHPGIRQGHRAGHGTGLLLGVLHGHFTQSGHVPDIIRHRQTDHLQCVKGVRPLLVEGDLALLHAVSAVAQVKGHPIPLEGVQGAFPVEVGLFAHAVAADCHGAVVRLALGHLQIFEVHIGLAVRRAGKGQRHRPARFLDHNGIVLQLGVLLVFHRPGYVLSGQPGLGLGQLACHCIRLLIRQDDTLEQRLLSLQRRQLVISGTGQITGIGVPHRQGVLVLIDGEFPILPHRLKAIGGVVLGLAIVIRGLAHEVFHAGRSAQTGTLIQSPHRVGLPDGVQVKVQIVVHQVAVQHTPIAHGAVAARETESVAPVPLHFSPPKAIILDVTGRRLGGVDHAAPDAPGGHVPLQLLGVAGAVELIDVEQHRTQGHQRQHRLPHLFVGQPSEPNGAQGDHRQQHHSRPRGLFPAARQVDDQRHVPGSHRRQDDLFPDLQFHQARQQTDHHQRHAEGETVAPPVGDVAEAVKNLTHQRHAQAHHQHQRSRPQGSQFPLPPAQEEEHQGGKDDARQPQFHPVVPTGVRADKAGDQLGIIPHFIEQVKGALAHIAAAGAEETSHRRQEDDQRQGKAPQVQSHQLEELLENDLKLRLMDGNLPNDQVNGHQKGVDKGIVVAADHGQKDHHHEGPPLPLPEPTFASGQDQGQVDDKKGHEINVLGSGEDHKPGAGVNDRTGEHRQHLPFLHTAAVHRECPGRQRDLRHGHHIVDHLHPPIRRDDGQEEQGVDMEDRQDAGALPNGEIPLRQHQLMGGQEGLSRLHHIPAGVIHNGQIEVLAVRLPHSGVPVGHEGTGKDGDHQQKDHEEGAPVQPLPLVQPPSLRPRLVGQVAG